MNNHDTHTALGSYSAPEQLSFADGVSPSPVREPFLTDKERDFQTKRSRFLDYHKKNPDLFDTLVQIVHEKMDQGETEGEIQQIYAEARKRFRGSATNTHMPFYSRMLMYKVRRFRKFFGLSQQPGAPAANRNFDKEIGRPARWKSKQ